ncbi:MAG: hypothetical protein HZA80_00300 [Candidatus Taylorbacteria bacterium]|nr:hypothetical protein [Candidatus Taylorbacteria bacterium]
MKRLKITKNKKILARAPGQNHFNSKESRRSQLNKKRMGNFPISNKAKTRLLVNA